MNASKHAYGDNSCRIRVEIRLCVSRDTQAPNLFSTLTSSADPPMHKIASVRM